MTDKLSRLSTFTESGNLQVKDESVMDTLLDVVNYAVLLAAFLDSERRDEADGEINDDIPAGEA